MPKNKDSEDLFLILRDLCSLESDTESMVKLQLEDSIRSRQPPKYFYVTVPFEASARKGVQREL